MGKGGVCACARDREKEELNSRARKQVICYVRRKLPKWKWEEERENSKNKYNFLTSRKDIWKNKWWNFLVCGLYKIMRNLNTFWKSLDRQKTRDGQRCSYEHVNLETKRTESSRRVRVRVCERETVQFFCSPQRDFMWERARRWEIKLPTNVEGEAFTKTSAFYLRNSSFLFLNLSKSCFLKNLLTKNNLHKM